jgi:nucleoside-diphosphate-sugar epimerase
MKNILLIGGTRNMGYMLAQALAAAGQQVTVLNRGLSDNPLPDNVYRLRADRTDPQQMRRALLAKSFDVVVDFVMFNEREAGTMVELLRGNVGHYIFISSGQVYLVREGIERPFKESDYAGRLLPAPKHSTYAHEEWRYGIDKRAAEDVLLRAVADQQFPATILRLPMVNSENDPFKRLYSYILRLKDGGPILVPQTPNYPLRHVYAGDVVQVLQYLIETGQGKGETYNISQDETVTIDEFLHLLAELLQVKVQLRWFKQSELEAQGFLPDCSPFSDRWMSELTNDKSKSDLDITYTPLPAYLQKLVLHYENSKLAIPVGYKRRHAEIQYAEHTPS